MVRVDKVGLYYHTVRRLKFRQIFWRLIRRYHRPKVSTSVENCQLNRVNKEVWRHSIAKPYQYKQGSQLVLLNQSCRISDDIWFKVQSMEKLWRYNLHYFDCLHSKYKVDHALGVRLLDSWVRFCSFGFEDAWEPYPISLRLVNCIKYVLNGGELSEFILRSLFIQARYLAKIPEYHILANHLFENAKALVFAGLFFVGKEPDSWFKLGMRILIKEVDEQILADGGHFELSPMYHNIILEGMLDLVNLFKAYEKALPHDWSDKVDKMLYWSQVMTHPDGEVPFFNDSTKGVASSPAAIQSYAKQLGFELKPALGEGGYHLEASNYIRVQVGQFVLFLDCAEVGVSYQPGHAHADTLSFELSYFGKRVVVNSGTSSYQDKAVRLFERSTQAHSTVVVNQKNSSQIWGDFRVAQRAHPFNLTLERIDDSYKIVCSHDGYEKSESCVVKRSWLLSAAGLLVEDEVISLGLQQCRANYILGEEWSVVQNSNGKHLLLCNKAGQQLAVTSEQIAAINAVQISQGMGLRCASQCFSYQFERRLSCSIRQC